MNGSKALAREILQGLPEELEGIEVIVFPPFPLLGACREGAVSLGGQNCGPKESGPYTGEVSPALLKEEGCDYVLLGHSERRLLGEPVPLITQKIQAALSAGLTPILCCGEEEKDIQNGTIETTLSHQLSSLKESVKMLQDNKPLLVAYEPVWAIGTGQVAQVKDIINRKQFIQQYLQHLNISSFHFLYGGSVTGKTVPTLMQARLNGFLIGGASLKQKDFSAILLSTAKVLSTL